VEHAQQQVLRLKRCEELGINCMIQAGTASPIHAGKRWQDAVLQPRFLFAVSDRRSARSYEDHQGYGALGSIAIQYSAAGADEIWEKGEFNKVREWCKIVRIGCSGWRQRPYPEAFMKWRTRAGT